MPDSFDDVCSLWPGADLGGGGGRIRVMHPHTEHFQKFLMHTIFCIILNLLDSDKPCYEEAQTNVPFKSLLSVRLMEGRVNSKKRSARKI